MKFHMNIIHAKTTQNENFVTATIINNNMAKAQVCELGVGTTTTHYRVLNQFMITDLKKKRKPHNLSRHLQPCGVPINLDQVMPCI